MGAPSKLTTERLDMLEQAVGLGLTEEEAAQAVGIGRSTLAGWRLRAEKVHSYFSTDRKRHVRRDLEALAKELDVRTAPRGKKLTNAKLAERLLEIGSKYLEFLDRMKAAAPKAEASLLAQLETSARGGLVITDVDAETGNIVRRGVRVTKTITEKTWQKITSPDGEVSWDWVPTKIAEVTEEKELPPDRLAILKLLELRWPEKYGKHQADVNDPVETARAIAAASEAMYQSVPGPPAPEGEEDELDALLDELDAMDDAEVDAALAEFGAA